jgi:alpha-tubulin suppressor-like RCC1 family protein
MATISLGKVAFTWKGAYDATLTYNGQDVVNEDGTTYIAKDSVPINSTPSATPASWDVFAQGVEGVASNANELVYFDGTQLQALTVGTAGQILKLDENGVPEWNTHPARQSVRAKGLVQGNPMLYRRGAAVMQDGSARWWGRGENWMHGAGNQTSDRSYPVRTGFPADAAAIDRMWGEYEETAVAITTDGKLWVWGQNNDSEVGRGSSADTKTPYCASDQSANSINGKTIIDYAPMCSNENEVSVLVLASDGTVHSCGYNAYGQLGMGDTTLRNRYNQIPVLSGITKICRGRSLHTSCMALKSDGTVYSWGKNSSGQLGTGNTTQMNIPMQIMYFLSNSITITDIGMGQDFSWAIDEDKNLYTWGENGYGNLGRNGTTDSSTPAVALTDVVFATGFKDDYMNLYAIKSDGSVWATGDNSYGCLGTASNTTDRNTFAESKKSNGTGFTNASKIWLGGSGSYNRAYILDTDGIAWACGYSGNGALGTGSYDTTNYWFKPVLIHRRTVTDIRPVGNSSEGGAMFLLDDGQVLQTGYAGESQLPEDDDESISVPMPVIF